MYLVTTQTCLYFLFIAWINSFRFLLGESGSPALQSTDGAMGWIST